jgi:hypothetical protein
VNQVVYFNDCPTGLKFDSRYNYCNWPDGVVC